MLENAIEYVKGVGPQRADLIKKELGIFTLEQLLQYFPFRHYDRSKFYEIREIHEDLPYIQLKGIITKFNKQGEGRSKRLTAEFQDPSGKIELVWFQGIQYIEKMYVSGQPYIIFGKPSRYGQKFNIVHPEIEPYTPENVQFLSYLQPAYNSTEKLKSKGLDSKGIAKIIKAAIASLTMSIPEILPAEILTSHRLISRHEAIVNLHFPVNQEILKKSEFRMKFEELFINQLGILRNKNLRKQTTEGFVFQTVGQHFNDFYYQHLKFQLTGAQKRVIKEIRQDTLTGKQMNRLLQGDVGSGKTVVALLTMLIACDNGFQSALMAPTEILAQQHFATFKELLKDMPLQIKLLTGSTKKAERKVLLEELAQGKIHILIGTHALIENPVVFKNLGFAVIDEQHRFGVAQRAALQKKNTLPPHVLVMTATPIPRTLAMTLYGDLEVSVIDELPPGRKPIQTLHYFETKRLALIGFLKNQIKEGRQIYIVYPLIKESEKMDYAHLEAGYQAIQRDFPAPDYRVSIVHGQMKNQLRDEEMDDFVKGKTHILVATTVIEVGVNVPNASVMVIESAERFGLSQLHQLRGRVGRGNYQSYCILMTDYKLSADSRVRMDTMCRTIDGFEISEVDLELRGPGEIDGTRQSGMTNFNIANLAKDQEILKLARNNAENLLLRDPGLQSQKHYYLLKAVVKQQNGNTLWSKIA